MATKFIEFGPRDEQGVREVLEPAATTIKMRQGPPFRLDAIRAMELEQSADLHPLSTKGNLDLAREVNATFMRKGWTIKSASEATGLSPETLIKLKLGDPTVRRGTVARFAAKLGDLPETWLELCDEKISHPALTLKKTQNGCIDVNDLTPPAQVIARMLVDLLPRHSDPQSLSVKDVIRQPGRGGQGLTEDEKVVVIAISGPGYMGLMGNTIEHIAALGVNIINISAHASGRVAAIFMRVVAKKDMMDEELQKALQDALNNNRHKGDKPQEYAVFAADEPGMERGPLMGIELNLRDKPGVMSSVLAVVYKHGFVPVAIEHSIPLKGADGEATCFMAIESLSSAESGEFDVEGVALLIKALSSDSLVLSAEMAFGT